jgi:hypothetical protein
MKYTLCPICIVVSGMWLVLSAGVAWGFLAPSAFLIPIALLMGGSVIGITNRLDSIRWKIVSILVGMSLAYLAVTHVSPAIVVLELIILLIFAYLFFVQKPSSDDPNIRDIEEKLKRCC